MLNIFNKIQFRAQKEIQDSRPSSFPFVSGDGFRAMSDYVLDSMGDVENLYQSIDALKNNYSRLIIIFVKASILETQSYRIEVLKLLEHIRKMDLKIKLIVHNGDKIPDNNYYKDLKNYCEKIFSVCFNDEIEGVISIPIGLENYYHLKNGLLSNFIRKNTVANKAEKNISIYCNFNPKTNPIERLPLIELIGKSRHDYVAINLPSKDYIKNLNSSKFVISPPGNGSDCHRTWEALAMNAVPVIKKGSLADSLVMGTPIHEVDDWGAFLNMSEIELNALYSKCMSRPKDILYLYYWLKVILD